MDFFINFVNKERAHFHKLSQNGQKLLKTITLYELANPLFSIFITAFLWRQTQSIPLIVTYYVAVNVGVPLGFYLNGLLLRTFPANILSFFGLLLQGIIASSIIFLPPLSIEAIGLFGFFDGLAIGIFWANRNLLTLKTTTSETRIYFSGLESIITTYCKIIVPILLGWFIVLGTKTDLYTALTGYKIMAVFMLGIIGVYGVVMNTFKMELTTYKQLFLHTASSAWKKFRLLQIILGFLQGVLTILPALMVLNLLGHEGTLGTVQSLAAILSAFAVYKIAKTIGIQHRLLLLQISIVIGLLGAVLFSIFFSGVGVLIFYATQAISQPLWWMATSSLNYDLIDNDKDGSTHYAYISDQEIYLNAGRIVSLLVFLGLVQTVSSDFALRFTPLIFAFAQILMSFLTKSIEKKN